MKTYVVTPHLNRLNETVLMMGQKICFYHEIWIIPVTPSHLELWLGFPILMESELQSPDTKNIWW